MRSLGKLFFKPVYSEKVIEHIVRRKNNLEKALKYSKEFVEFLLAMPAAEIEPLFKAHNNRWNHPKYHDVCVELEDINHHLVELKDNLQRKQDHIDPLINHIYAIKAPKIM